MIINDIFLGRQKKVFNFLGDDSIAIIFANQEVKRNGDNHYPFRQDSDFYYLTGFPEPDAVAVLTHEKYILFVRDKDVQKEIWNGYRVGQEGACKDYGANDSYSIDAFSGVIANLIRGHKNIYFNMSSRNMKRITKIMDLSGGQARSGANLPNKLVDIGEITHEMRLIKDHVEIATMREASKIAANAHSRVMASSRVGMKEYELEAELRYEYIKKGGRAVSFEPIVAAGGNACTLHYVDNNSELKAGELVLVDAGIEYDHYASDITRTFPVDGTFTEEQAAIYQAVLDVQSAVIDFIKPGITWIELQLLSEEITKEQLAKLGIDGDFKRFYVHHIGHWIGIDAHDVGKYRLDDGSWRVLAPGMVLTVEPGLYIRAEAPGVAEKWWNVGVRIEDEVLITEKGNEVLTAAVPKEISELEIK